VSRSSKKAQLLVERFIDSFGKLDDLTAFDTDPVAGELTIGEPDQFGFKHWRPSKFSTDEASIEQLYANLPGRFPRLFELLLLSYRWAEVDLGLYRLLANPPGPGLGGFLQRMSKDPALWKCLMPAGYLQFGKGPDNDYDPVCFDMRSRNKNGDRRIVKIDHEEVLCNDRVKIRSELAPSFEQLMVRTIDQVNKP
jgi:hypothetical protein